MYTYTSACTHIHVYREFLVHFVHLSQNHQFVLQAVMLELGATKWDRNKMGQGLVPTGKKRAA